MARQKQFLALLFYLSCPSLLWPGEAALGARLAALAEISVKQNGLTLVVTLRSQAKAPQTVSLSYEFLVLNGVPIARGPVGRENMELEPRDVIECELSLPDMPSLREAVLRLTAATSQGATVTKLARAILPAGLAAARAVTFAGHVVGPGGKPVSAAQIWVLRHYNSWPVYHRPSVLLARGQADARGRFEIPDIRFFASRSEDRAISVVATGPGLAAGLQDIHHTDERLVRRAARLRIEVGDAAPYAGLIRDRAGEPVPGATVTVRSIRVIASRRGEPPWRHSLDLCPELTERFAATSRKDGRFIIEGIPGTCEVMVHVSAPGYGSSTHSLESHKPPHLTVARAGSVRGRLVCAEEPQAAAGVLISYTGKREGAWSSGDTRTDRTGAFALTDLPPGKYTIGVRYDPASVWQAAVEEVELAEAARVTDLTVTLQRGVLVTGEVRDEATRTPLPGARICGWLFDRHRGAPEVVTGPEGCFQFYTLPGRVRAHVAVPPEGYLDQAIKHSRRDRSVTVGAPGPVTMSPFQLGKARVLRGATVDEQGQPVPYAQVCTLPLMSSSMILSDARGRFEFPGLHPRLYLELAATAEPDLMLDVMEVFMRKTKGPLRVVLRRNAASRAQMRVVDDAGNPVPDALVRFVLDRRHSDERLVRLLTDEQGRCEAGRLWPNAQYRAKARAPGHGEAESDFWQAKAGETHVFPDLVLARANAWLAGTTVDPQGRPLGGVRVFNRGDSDRVVETTTDEQGRFRLEGVFPGTAYAFAETPAHRLAGAMAPTGATDVRLVLRRKDTRPEPRELPPLHTPDYERDRVLAKDLIQRTWELTRDTKFRKRAELVKLMAQLDEDLAFELSAEEGGQHDAALVRTLARQLAATNLDEALVLFSEDADARRRAEGMIDAAAEVAKHNPDSAARLLREGARAAEAVRDPRRRAPCLASAGAELLELGHDEGLDLLEDAVHIVKNSGHTGRHAEARLAVAESLCRWQTDAALELIESLEPGYRYDRHTSAIAEKLAAEQPDLAIDLLGKIGNDWYRDKAVLRVFRRLARSSLPRGIELAERAELRNRTKSLAYAYLARAVAETDRARAHELLEQAVQIQTAKAQRGNSFNNVSSPAAVVARVAQIARDIGYPDVPGLVLRAMSLRLTHREAWDSTRRRRSNTVLAFCLAYVDADTARWLIEPLVEPFLREQLDTYVAGHSLRNQVMVHALASLDPTRAAEAVLAMPDDKPDRADGRKGASLLQLIEFLLLEPGKRRDHVMEQCCL